MKAIKGVSLFFAGLIILVSSCFNPPEFGLVPKIEFESIYFGKNPDPFKSDSIVIAITFKDGDGDLGLDASGAEGSDPGHSQTPFNPFNFFLAKDGAVAPVGLSQHWDNIGYYFIDVGDKQGKLVTAKTVRQGGYGFLPEYSLGSCYYAVDTIIMVDEPDAAILDANFQNIIDTLHSPSDPSIFVLQDTFYLEANPNHYNIKVDFLVKNTATGEFESYPWSECDAGFDGRFPVLSDNPGGPLDGTLRYSLVSGHGFYNSLLIQTLKIKVTIQDRALNSSNTIETPEFTLNHIQR